MGDGPRRRSGEGPAGSRLDDALVAPAVRRGFLLGESGELRYAGPTARPDGQGANSIGNPWIPLRIGGPLSTARDLSTVLKAPLPPRVRGWVRLSPLTDHTLAVAGDVFTVGNWSLPMWCFQKISPSLIAIRISPATS